MPKLLVKIFSQCFLVYGLIVLFTGRSNAEELFLEPVIQGYSIDEVLEIVKENDTFYIAIEELAQILQFKLLSGNMLQGAFLGQEFNIDIKTLPSQNYRLIGGKYYFSIDFYEKIFPIHFEIDTLEMQIKITSDKELPLTIGVRNQQRQKNFVPLDPPDSFSNYQFDERMLSTPVVDITYQKGFTMNDYNGDNERHYNSDYYQADFGMLLGGFDTYASFFGDNNTDDYAPRARINVGRTFLDEPKNALNLTTFEAGDVTGFNSTLFNNSSSGRGIFASSFKDLVLSADKTIDINGPLSEGWNVELYLNDQLIGFRQSGINGRYQFPNVPVNYGLNAFKLVFYGPYGEVETEERNYYSGTSPVKKGEFGYTLNAYQKDHYLFEENEPFVNPSTKPVLDYMGYYGVSDDLTLINGFTHTPNAITDETQNFGTAGLQYIWSGASFQYNAMHNFENQATGHHADVQGNIGIGDILARYDYYGDLESPISYYNDEYLKSSAELRLTGYIPISDFALPYYVSYQQNDSISGEKIEETHLRLSPNFMSYYNFTFENIWYNEKFSSYTDTILLLQAQYNDLGLHSQVQFRNESSASYLYRLRQQADYRWNKNTYFQANWDRDCRSEYSTESDLDTFSVSAGRLFSFGGLTLTLSADTDNNASVFLTYNISFGKVPGRAEIFSNSQASMSERGSLYAKAVDENNQPLPNTKLKVTGLQDPVTTDENGEALITDIEPYQKTILSVDLESIEDVSLQPEFETKKLVLRPGTVYPLVIPFAHKGALEGAISGNDKLYTYKIVLMNKDGKIIAAKTPEKDGSFIFDDVSFGAYKLVVTNQDNQKMLEKEINLKDDYYSLSEPLAI